MLSVQTSRPGLALTNSDGKPAASFLVPSLADTCYNVSLETLISLTAIH